LIDGGTQAVQRIEVRYVERDERCLSTDLVDFVVNFFKPADGACDEDDVSAFGGIAQRDGAPDAARRACDNRNPVLKAFTHILNSYAISASSDNCRVRCSPFRSVRGVGYSPVKQ